MRLRLHVLSLSVFEKIIQLVSCNPRATASCVYKAALLPLPGVMAGLEAARAAGAAIHGGAGPPPHGLSSNTMALITTECDAMRSLRTKWP